MNNYPIIKDMVTKKLFRRTRACISLHKLHQRPPLFYGEMGIPAVVKVVPGVAIGGVAASVVLPAFNRENGGCHWSEVGVAQAACAEAVQ